MHPEFPHTFNLSRGRFAVFIAKVHRIATQRVFAAARYVDGKGFGLISIEASGDSVGVEILGGFIGVAVFLRVDVYVVAGHGESSVGDDGCERLECVS